MNNLSAANLFQTFGIDTATEEQARALLREYLISIKQWNLEKNLDELLTVGGGFLDRLHFIEPQLDTRHYRSLLVSGCAVGSELILARNRGFLEALGTEVISEYVTIGSKRLGSVPNTAIQLYDGIILPFSNDRFSCIASGHIIEHTKSPINYLREHMRVLEPGGMLFLEFPDRYHSIELHTGLKSYEWLPWPLRNLMLRFNSSRFGGHTREKRDLYRAVRLTLKPISIWQIKMYLFLLGYFSSRIVAIQIPAPGFTRIMIQK